MVNMNSLPAETRRELAFTPEELAELENARKMPITFDEDCPIKFKRVNPPRKTADAQ